MNNIVTVTDTDETSWIAELRRQCQLTSQAKVAKKLDMSSAVISQVLNDKYPGDVKRIEKIVRGAFLGETVSCPVMGELSLDRCLSFQKQELATINPMRVRMYRACRQCDISNL